VEEVNVKKQGKENPTKKLRRRHGRTAGEHLGWVRRKGSFLCQRKKTKDRRFQIR